MTNPSPALFTCRSATCKYKDLQIDYDILGLCWGRGGGVGMFGLTSEFNEKSGTLIWKKGNTIA